MHLAWNTAGTQLTIEASGGWVLGTYYTLTIPAGTLDATGAGSVTIEGLPPVKHEGDGNAKVPPALLEEVHAKFLDVALAKGASGVLVSQATNGSGVVVEDTLKALEKLGDHSVGE